nr:hypothetical protein Iba_chr06aCG11290 [Ipomoea batatas]GMD05890.1 hypothetical protein Iba_chr06bCG10800 [Ipomoea batatas]
MMTRHLMSCSLAYSYCSVRLGSRSGTNSALIFSSHSSATSSILSTNKPPPPLEQTRTLIKEKYLQGRRSRETCCKIVSRARLVPTAPGVFGFYSVSPMLWNRWS